MQRLQQKRRYQIVTYINTLLQQLPRIMDLNQRQLKVGTVKMKDRYLYHEIIHNLSSVQVPEDVDRQHHCRRAYSIQNLQ